VKTAKKVVSALAVVAALGLVALVSLSNVGCDKKGDSSASSKTYKLAFVTNNASDFWKIAAAGVRKYEKEGKVQVDVKMPPNGTVEEQNRTLEELTSQGYDGIAVSVIAPADQIPALNKAAAKTNLITFDSDSPKSNRLLYIVPLLAIAGGAALLITLLRRWSGKPTSAAVPMPSGTGTSGNAPSIAPSSAPNTKPSRDDYDEKLDDELRRMDDE